MRRIRPDATSPSPSLACRAAPSETFSQLTLFLFGSGLALFVALLGWSDQIRGINKDTRDLETRFLATTRVEKSTFLAVAKSTDPNRQLQAVANLIGSAQLARVSDVELLVLFKSWNQQWDKLERFSSYKYDMTIVLTVLMFLSGVTSLFTSAGSDLRIFGARFRIEALLLTVPMLDVAALVCLIVLASRQDRRLRQLLSQIEDKV